MSTSIDAASRRQRSSSTSRTLDDPAGALHIFHVIDGIDVGGAEIVLVHLVEGLQAAGHRNTVAVLSTCGPLAARIAATGATILPLGMERGRLPALAVCHLLRAAHEARPTIIQGWMYHGNLAASVARLAAGSPTQVVWSIHNTIEPPQDMPRITRAARTLTRTASLSPAAIVYVAETAARQHERIGFSAARTKVIPNGTDCARFHPDQKAGKRLRSALGVDPAMPLVGLFARWHPMKGHTVLFEAAAALAASGNMAHLVLAGTGLTAANAELGAALQVTGLMERVSLLGARDDITALVSGLDIFALPSVYGEAFPLVLGEAMAAGVPCVATDVGDTRLIVGDTGSIVPPRDTRALAEALRQLIAAGPEERRRRGALARQRVVQMFSVERMVTAYATLYESASQGRAAPSANEPLPDAAASSGHSPMTLSPKPKTSPSDEACEWPTVAVVMPCRNEARHIEATVSAVLGFDYPPGRFSVVVSDGISDDGTAEILRRLAAAGPRLRVLQNPGRLPGPGINAAIAQTDAEIVLRVDAHTIYPRHYLKLCVRTLMLSGADNVGGVVVATPGAATPMARAIAVAMSLSFGVGNATFRTGSSERRWTDTVPFGCWWRQTLAELGGFAIDIPYGEDDELNARLLRRGGRILLDPAISSSYVTRPTLGSLATQMYRYGRFKPVSAWRVGSLTSMRQLVPSTFVAVVLLALALSIALPAAGLITAAALLSHFLVASLVAIRELPRLGLAAAYLPLIFLVMHGGYGLGYLLGMVAVLKSPRVEQPA